jgi:hypothetical protein
MEKFPLEVGIAKNCRRDGGHPWGSPSRSTTKESQPCLSWRSSPAGSPGDGLFNKDGALALSFSTVPLGTTAEECEDLRDLVTRTGVVFQVGNNRRFEPGMTAARRFITPRSCSPIR